jgi:hypothetical protein
MRIKMEEEVREKMGEILIENSVFNSLAISLQQNGFNNLLHKSYLKIGMFFDENQNLFDKGLNISILRRNV